MSKTAIIVDIDEVCSKTNEKYLMNLHADEVAKDDFSWFGKLVDNFEPSDFSLILVNLLARHHRIIFITSRNEKTREKTVEWINRHYIFRKYYPFKLYCRDMEDLRGAVEVKLDLYKKHVEGKYNVILALDDKIGICELWKSLGITSAHIMLKEEN